MTPIPSPAPIRSPWSEVPLPAAPVAAPRLLVGLLVALVGATGPVAWIAHVRPGVAPWAVAALALGAAVVASAIDDRRVVGAAWFVLGAATYGFAGEWTAAWLVAGSAAAAWALAGRAPVRSLPDAIEGLTPPVVGLSAVAAVVVLRSHEIRWGVVVAMIALVVEVAHPWIGAPATRLGSLVAAVAERVVGTLVFSLLGVVVVLLPWVFQRVFRLDPLLPRPGPTRGWLAVAGREPQPTRPWAHDPVTGTAPRALAVRRRLAGPATLAVVLSLVALTIREVRSGDGPPPTPYLGAIDPLPWWPAYNEDLIRLIDRLQPQEVPRVPDFSSRYINVTGGVRRTWAAPPCGCTRRSVWVYGGSTTFGLGQRDDHTIPSELARLAWERGIALDVSNRGVPGDMLWQEVQRFAWDLTTEPAPDVVIFYDGANELGGSLVAAADGRPLDARVDGLLERGWDHYVEAARAEGLSAPPEPRPVPENPVVGLAPRALATAVVERYTVARTLASELAADHGVRAIWTWQPTLVDRRRVEGEPLLSATDPSWFRDVNREISKRLPPSVVDLRDSLDGLDDPVFYDDTHTNEQGARVVAGRLFDIVRPELAGDAQ